MNDVLTQPTQQSDIEDDNALRQLFAEMLHLNELMRLDQADIERLKVETDALKGETLRLKTESRAILARLGAV